LKYAKVAICSFPAKSQQEIKLNNGPKKLNNSL